MAKDSEGRSAQRPRRGRRPRSPISQQDASQIEAAATHFRRTIDAVEDKKSLPVPFHEFPHGSCDPASRALGVYLREVLGIECVCANGEAQQQTHAWLEYGDLIIDVTADQFGPGQKPVIVTRDRSWHSRFAAGRPHQDRRVDAYPDWFKAYCEPVLRLIRATRM